MPRLPVAAVAFLLAAAPFAPAAAPDPVVERIQKDLDYLAGPECEGRGVQTAGILKAADHVAAAFKAAGLRPGGPDGSYFQPFTITGSPKLGTPNTLTLTGPDGKAVELAYGTDFTPTGMTKDGKLSAGLAFAGYGITADQPKYDDYAGLDVKGKWVVVLRKAPRAGDKTPPFNQEQQALVSKTTTAKGRGAAGVLLVNPAGEADDPLMEFGYAAGASAGVPVLHVKRAVADRLLAAVGTSLAEYETAVDKDLTPRSRPLPGWTAAATVTVERPKIPARNVVGVADGSGPLADETVVIGAHYDHLGLGEFGSLGGKDAKGKVHYGADDNASGTAALIELARRFGPLKNRDGRRLVFVAFSGEEIALLGSRHYVDHPVFPLEKTAFMLNMDMVGRMVPVADDPKGGTAGKMRDRLVVYGTGTADGLEKLVDEAAAPFDFKLLKVPAGTGPSDHDSFYRKKVPVLFFFTGTHRDYHRPTDTPDKINVPGVKKVADYVESVTEKLAAGPKPAYLVTKSTFSDPTDPNPRPARSGPRLGVMPGNYESDDGGVLVDDVSPGGAAEKAGIRKGDVIVEIGGVPVKNIGGYMAAMGKQKAGQKVDVVVVRKDKKVTVSAVPQ